MPLSIDDDQLLKQCRLNTFRSKGAGGQHVNVTDSAVRLTHLPTGFVVSCQSERSQYLNKKLCLEKLKAKIAKSLQVKKKRVKTNVPKTEKLKRLNDKKKLSYKKNLRQTKLSQGEF